MDEQRQALIWSLGLGSLFTGVVGRRDGEQTLAIHLVKELGDLTIDSLVPMSFKTELLVIIEGNVPSWTPANRTRREIPWASQPTSEWSLSLSDARKYGHPVPINTQVSDTRMKRCEADDVVQLCGATVSSSIVFHKLKSTPLQGSVRLMGLGEISPRGSYYRTNAPDESLAVAFREEMHRAHDRGAIVIEGTDGVRAVFVTVHPASWFSSGSLREIGVIESQEDPSVAFD